MPRQLHKRGSDLQRDKMNFLVDSLRKRFPEAGHGGPVLFNRTSIMVEIYSVYLYCLVDTKKKINILS